MLQRCCSLADKQKQQKNSDKSKCLFSTLYIFYYYYYIYIYIFFFFWGGGEYHNNSKIFRGCCSTPPPPAPAPRGLKSAKVNDFKGRLLIAKMQVVIHLRGWNCEEKKPNMDYYDNETNFPWSERSRLIMSEIYLEISRTCFFSSDFPALFIMKRGSTL